jgi:hypothetical protein
MCGKRGKYLLIAEAKGRRGGRAGRKAYGRLAHLPCRKTYKPKKVKINYSI